MWMELGYDVTLMLIPSYVGIQGNERADVLGNEGSISGTLFQDQAGLTTVNTSDIQTRASTRLLTEWQERWNDSEMCRYCYSVLPRVSIEAWMASTVAERVFLVAMSRLASNHTGTRTHLQRINVIQDAFCQCAMGNDTIDHGLWECERHCTLRNELQEKLRATGMEHGKSIRDILAMRKALFRMLKGHGFAHLDKCLRVSTDPLDTGSNPKPETAVPIFSIFL
jgi:hypothetical protein